MHTLTCDPFAINYNGDFSGDVIIRHRQTGGSFTVPYSVLEELVAEKVRQDRIATLEQATTEELLS